MSDNLYVVTYSTESGDSGLVGVFDFKPTRELLKKLGKKWYPGEYEYGNGCTIYYDVQKVENIITSDMI